MRTFLLCALLGGALNAAAQALPDKPEPQTPPARRHVLGIVPTYDVVSIHDQFQPLSARRKFKFFTEATFDRFTIIESAAAAGVAQWSDVPHGYGQGGEGYAKRFGAALGDKVVTDFFKSYAYPALFRQDPRYFAMTSANGASKGTRIGHAIAAAFINRGDNGNWQPGISKLLANATGAAAVNLFYPPEDRHIDDSLARFGAKIGVDVANNILKEFWRGISGKFSRKKQR